MERAKLLVLPHHVMFNATHSAETQQKLTLLINKGYDKPRFRFNIVKTPRIKFSLGQDLEMQDKKDSMIGICVHPDANWALDPAVVFKSEDIDLEIVENPDFRFTDDLFKQVIGSVGLKPFVDEKENQQGDTLMEITALTSFYPKLGAVLVQKLEQYMLLKKKHTKVYAHVIADHDLVPFYEKIGFKVIELTRIEIDPATGRVVGNHLEDGIQLNESFTLALMDKAVQF